MAKYSRTTCVSRYQIVKQFSIMPQQEVLEVAVVTAGTCQTC